MVRKIGRMKERKEERNLRGLYFLCVKYENCSVDLSTGENISLICLGQIKAFREID